MTSSRVFGKLWAAALMVFFALAQSAAAAETVLLWTTSQQRATVTSVLQSETSEALQERGFSVITLPTRTAETSPEELSAFAGQYRASRVFVLRLASSSGATFSVSLRRHSVQTGLPLQPVLEPHSSPLDGQNVASHLVSRALDGRPSAGEAQANTTHTNEFDFLMGVSLSGGVIIAPKYIDDDLDLYGAALHFLFEAEDHALGFSLDCALVNGGRRDNGQCGVSVRGYYRFGESDLGGFLGGALGLSVFVFQTIDAVGWGGHAILSGGVEFFRRNPVRLRMSVDVLLPFYILEQDPHEVDVVAGRNLLQKTAYVVTPTLNLGVFF